MKRCACLHLQQFKDLQHSSCASFTRVLQVTCLSVVRVYMFPRPGILYVVPIRPQVPEACYVYANNGASICQQLADKGCVDQGLWHTVC